jgi:hypothetical protein
MSRRQVTQLEQAFLKEGGLGRTWQLGCLNIPLKIFLEISSGMFGFDIWTFEALSIIREAVRDVSFSPPDSCRTF